MKGRNETRIRLRFSSLENGRASEGKLTSRHGRGLVESGDLPIDLLGARCLVLRLELRLQLSLELGLELRLSLEFRFELRLEMLGLESLQDLTLSSDGRRGFGRVEGGLLEDFHVGKVDGGGGGDHSEGEGGLQSGLVPRGEGLSSVGGLRRGGEVQRVSSRAPIDGGEEDEG